MSDDIISDSGTHTQHPLDKIVESLPKPVRKLGRDLTISVFFNACTFVAHTLPGLVQSDNTLTQIFAKAGESFALGTGVLAAGIATGRYIGGGIGMIVDKATHHSDGKFRKAFAAAGGTAIGAAAFVAYRAGIWPMSLVPNVG